MDQGFEQLKTIERSAYRVGLWAQVNFSAPTFEPAHEGQRAALSVQSAAAAMRPLDQRFANELYAQRAAKNVIDFCRGDRNRSS